MIETTLLETERLLLRVMPPRENEAVRGYLRRAWPFVEPWMPLVEEDYFTLAGQRRRLAAEEEARLAGRGVRFFLIRRDDLHARPCGDLHLSQIIRGAFQSCFIGYKLEERFTGQGYMAEAVRRVTEFAFAELDLHRIEANIMPRNAASRRLAERCGFVEEGMSRCYLRIQGVWEDHMHYVLINPAHGDGATG